MAKTNPLIPLVDIQQQQQPSATSSYQLITLGTVTGGTPYAGAAYANIFSRECLLQDLDGSGVYQMTGTVAVPAWTLIGPGAVEVLTASPINATTTATAAEVATGYITSTSAAPTTITLPTGTLLGAELGAVAGTVHELYVDNTGGASTVTMAVATNGILSDAAETTAASFGQLTVASGVTGQARFTLMFSSATAYTFTRTA